MNPIKKQDPLKDTQLTSVSECTDSKIHREPQRGIHLGDWFIYNDKKHGRILASAKKIGSNYVEMEGLPLDKECSASGRSSWRHPQKDLYQLVPEPDWQALIAAQVEQRQSESMQIMMDVQKITRRLGVQPQNAMLSHMDDTPENAAGTSLAVLSAENDVRQYALDLKAADEKELPELFKRMKSVQEQMSNWMQLPLLSVQTMMKNAETVMEPLKERVFQVGLYAGLTEQAEQIATGEPAAYHEKLHIFQLRRYMDEECLLSAHSGGMDIQNITDFDAWLAQPENRDRLLPYPRSLIAMRIRRNIKDRDWAGSLNRLRINIHLEKMDRLTFLLIRNGENLYRINTELDFPEWIIPEEEDFWWNEPMMFRTFGSSIDERSFMSVRAYEQVMSGRPKDKDGASEWKWRVLDEYEKLTPESIYYDDVMAIIHRKQQEFNRIALIIQGLLDRSTALHPHPPVNLGTPSGCDQMLVLVRDGSMVLTSGEKPDFEAYRKTLNAQITDDSVFVGHRKAWTLREAYNESRRMDHDRNHRGDWRPEQDPYWEPFGEDGPDMILTAQKITFKKGLATKATFAWRRPSRRDPYGDVNVTAKITVPVSDLLNISAYRAGDYRIFFSDPRTRADYLQWAPLLLEAERWRVSNPIT